MERGTGIGKGSGKSTIRKTKTRKVTSKNVTDNCDVSDEEPPAQQQPGSKRKGTKKRKEKHMMSRVQGGKKSKQSQYAMNEMQKDVGYYSAGQNKINDMMRRALEDEKYSALGSIVDTDSSDDDSSLPAGARYGINRSAVLDGFQKNLIREKTAEIGSSSVSMSKDKLSSSRGDKLVSTRSSPTGQEKPNSNTSDNDKGKEDEQTDVTDDNATEALDDEEESNELFGQPPSNNSTWVECDKCHKWRRLRGVVDTKKLPPKWFCSMNKNDPERAKCSAPEEEYTENNTPESATDHRIRKHLRLWVRRLQSNEAYEQKLPTMTRGKKKSVTANSKEPYEWIRCANPSCGKFRAILRFMDSSTIMESVKNGEWFCVLNTWDEKMASCAAPQENLPVSGCPPWVLKDE